MDGDNIPEKPQPWAHYEPGPWHDAAENAAHDALTAWDEAITTAEAHVASIRRAFSEANAEFVCSGMSHARLAEIGRATDALWQRVQDLEDVASMTEALS